MTNFQNYIILIVIQIVNNKGGNNMAASSIFASFNINDNQKADRFVTALEESEKEPLRTPEAPTPPRRK